jgi:predicted acyl esterase
MGNGERKTLEGITVKDYKIQVRDEIELAVRVYLPSADGEYPTLYCASPYQYETDHLPPSSLFPWYEVGPFDWYVREQGYAFVHLDVRGSGQSGGDWDPFSPTEREDHREVLDWLMAQPWCDGKIGTYGQSYYAISQWMMAQCGSPHISCLGVFDGAGDIYRCMAYRGGIASQFYSHWTNLVVHNHAVRLDTREEGRFINNPMPEVVRHQTDDQYWRDRSPVWGFENIDIPLYSIGVWGKRDLHLEGSLDGYRLAGGEKKLLVLNPVNIVEAHELFAEVDFHRETLLPFYDYYLKGAENDWKENTPDVKYWVYGREAYREDTTWPPSAASGEKVLYLGEGPTGSIQSLNDGSLNGAPSQNDASFTELSYPHMSWDIGNVAFGRFGPDAQLYNNTFTSAPLEEDLELVGNPKLLLFISSTQIDTDIVLKLQEQLPCSEEEIAAGEQPFSKLVTKGKLRASHRGLNEEWTEKLNRPFHDHRNLENLVPGEIYELEIGMIACAHMFKKGSRIRLDLSNTDSNLTDHQLATLYHWEKVGTDTYYHSTASPSRLILPAI